MEVRRIATMAVLKPFTPSRMRCKIHLRSPSCRNKCILRISASYYSPGFPHISCPHTTFRMVLPWNPSHKHSHHRHIKASHQPQWRLGPFLRVNFLLPERVRVCITPTNRKSIKTQGIYSFWKISVVGPYKSTIAIKTKASNSFMLLSFWIPLSSPRYTEVPKNTDPKWSILQYAHQNYKFGESLEYSRIITESGW